MCATGVPSSHSSTEGRVHGMAPCTRPTGRKGSAERAGLRATLVPYGVAAGKEAEWRRMQEALWAGRGDPRRNADVSDSAAIAAILREEVVQSL